MSSQQDRRTISKKGDLSNMVAETMGAARKKISQVRTGNEAGAPLAGSAERVNMDEGTLATVSIVETPKYARPKTEPGKLATDNERK